MKANFSKLVVEFISIVFAVLLALVLNQWRESEAMKNKVARVVENIRQEVTLIDSLTRKSLAYRMDLLEEMENDEHRIFTIPIHDLDIDPNDDQALAREIETALLFYNYSYYDRVEVRTSEDRRVLILDESVFSIENRNDTLWVLGVGRIQLRSADVSLNSFQIAQATGVLVELELDLVEELSQLNTSIGSYQATCGDAINFIYENRQQPFISSTQDMIYFEKQIIKSCERIMKMLDE